MRKKAIDLMPVLTEHIKAVLTSFSNSRSLPASLKQHSSIVLLASQGFSDRNVAAKVGLHYNNVATWRKRFLDALPTLVNIESVSPEKLSDEIQRLLSDQHRSGCTAIFTQEQILKIIDLACKPPSQFGYETSQWSLNLLVTEIKKQGIAEQISAKSVSRFLKMR